MTSKFSHISDNQRAIKIEKGFSMDFFLYVTNPGSLPFINSFMTEVCHIETRPLIFRANKKTGFYMAGTS